MEHYLIIARSVTHAQRIENVLNRAGIFCRISRAPMELAGRGCAYMVKIRNSDLSAALKAIHGSGLNPVQIYLATPDGYQEANP